MPRDATDSVYGRHLLFEESRFRDGTAVADAWLVASWELFRDGGPGGETPRQIGARADRVIARIRAVRGDVLLFTSGHFIRVLASRWLGVEPSVHSRFFMLSTASLSALGYEHDVSRPVIRLWNETRHVESDGSD